MHEELSSGPCDAIGGAMGVDGREGICAYVELIYVAVQYKLTQHTKAIILRLKKKAYFLELIPLPALPTILSSL